jgi:hypothetical protein
VGTSRTDAERPSYRRRCYLQAMTAFEKFILALVALWALSHLAVKWGTAAGVPATVISLAESAVTY